MILEIFNKFKQIATSHLMIKSFNYGDNFVIQKTGENLYPNVFLEFPFTLNYDKSFVDISFTYYVSEIPSDSQFDDINLLNKIEQINNDILMKMELNNYNEFENVNSVNSLTLNEWMGDKVVSIRTEISLRVLRIQNNCEAPFV